MMHNALLALATVLSLGMLVAGCSPSEPQPAPASRPVYTSVPAPPAAVAPQVPPYHESAEAAKPFPKILPAAYFRDYPIVARAYRIAGKIPGVLAQQPCYCWCDKFGHDSLLDCFATNHGAG